MNSRVYILDFGSNTHDISILLGGQRMGEICTIPIIGIYIDHPQAKIIVDTGVNDKKSPGALHFKHEHNENQTIKAQLNKIGINCEDINYVISSHLHYDHCGNNHLFPNAKVLVRRAELEKAYVPISPNDIAYYRPDFDRKELKYCILPNELDFELLDGISLIWTPGHSAGSQSVLIKTSEGNVLYAADAVYTLENWEKDILPGICYSGELQEKSIAKLKLIRDLILIPGHDPKLSLNRKRVYGI